MKTSFVIFTINLATASAFVVPSGSGKPTFLVQSRSTDLRMVATNLETDEATSIDDPLNYQVTITDRDLKPFENKKDELSLNSLCEEVTVQANGLLKEIQKYEEKNGGRVLPVAVIGAAIGAFGTITAAVAKVAGDVATTKMTNNAGTDAKPSWRDLRFRMKTEKWAIVALDVGVKKVVFITPPCDIDVNLTVETWNGGDGFLSAVLVGYLNLGPSETILDLPNFVEKMGMEGLKNSAITNEVLTSSSANIDIRHMKDEYLPKILLSRGVEDIYDARGAA